MIPRPGQALRDLAGRIGLNLAARVPDTYGATDAGMISLLLTMLAGELESGIERRLQDGREICELFATAVHAPDHSARQAFAGSQPVSLGQADVSNWLDEGLGLLIELHAWAEAADPTLNAAIWDYLYRHRERYRFDL